MKNLLSLVDVDNETVLDLIDYAIKIKKNPENYSTMLRNKTVLMLFEKPSIRTRLSFEAGIFQLGGNCVSMTTRETPLGSKETISDTAKCSSRFCDLIMARLYKQEEIEDLAKNSTVPVINGLTDTSHPCQILGDLQTIYEKKKKIKGLKLAFVGDGNNNITHDLLLGCSAVGMDISVGCPREESPHSKIVAIARKKAKKNDSNVEIVNNSVEAVKDADIVYADSWMSYHIPKVKKEERIKLFMPFQVNTDLMKQAKKDAIFMNNLPAIRGYEQTAEVIDGPQSIVFDQTENKLHMQKAIILKLLGKD
jgi:ornithine carbamoyltransferase